MPEQDRRPRAETAPAREGRARRVAGTCVVLIGGLLLLGSAAAKFTRVPSVVAEMDANGIGGYKLPLIAALEVASALLLLLRPTRSLGVPLVSAYLGGAIATHLQHDQSPVPPAVLLSAILVGAWLRHPEVLWSLRRGPGRPGLPGDGAGPAPGA
jgi:hypothetical protein